MIELKGNILNIIKNNCPVSFEAMYQHNIGQVTIYLDNPISKSELSYLQNKIMKYIGDNMLGDSYKTVKIFS